MLQKLLFAILACVFAVIVFVFTAAFVALGVTAAFCLGAWAWWRGRRTRRGGEVIEGEYRIIESK
jgi:uncharacterized membrane protein